MKNHDKNDLSAESRELRHRISLLERENAHIKNALLESEEKLSTLISAAPDLLCFKDQYGRWLEANEFTLNLFGLDQYQYKGKSDLELMEICSNYPDALDYCACTDKQAWLAGNPIKVELDISTKNGYTITFDIIKAPIYYPDGSPKGIVVMGRDVTTRKQMEEALRQRQKEFRTLAENSPDVIIRLDKNLTYLYVSPSVTRYTKIDPRMFIGKSMGKIAPSKEYITTFQEWKREVLAVINTGKPSTIESEMKLWWRRGELVAYHARFIPEFSESGLVESVLCIIQDVTEKRLLEKEFARLDRLNVVGEMAASIGHEVRNPMTTVRGFLQMLSKKSGCVQYNDYFTIMIAELDRANSIISEFLALAKNKAINRELYNINEIINSMMPLLEADGLMANKYIKTSLGEIPDILVDHKEIRQLILNLVRNGLEAMEAGGTLTIRTYLEGNDIILAVEDEGSGIEPEVMDKVGTPFFSTKEQGTGLGLAVCYSIANRHDAMLRYDTSLKGTIFFVIFQDRNGTAKEAIS
ncbi:PAS domain-containing sensor histidine kinase [Sporomusa malonica]|uniref:histidine kinase n=1 Tax=Sporomusa malonica TaxID=112901 RepID=A0A1W1ZUR3_9FIRM|nr:PAS domain-containing sensor histidine kinase [Sporomusa malonica]SMC51818.1 PAS domain S-box-containing protein [Sporomusa malonica]